MEPPGSTSDAVASDCTTRLENAHGTEFREHPVDRCSHRRLLRVNLTGVEAASAFRHGGRCVYSSAKTTRWNKSVRRIKSWSKIENLNIILGSVAVVDKADAKRARHAISP
jgi:hypothetical protein